MDNTKIIPPKTTLDYALEFFSLLSVLAMAVVIIWIKAFDFVALMLLFFSVSIYVGMTMLSRFPDKLNYPIKVTEENRQTLYNMTLRMARWVKLLVCLILTNSIWIRSFRGQKLATILFIILTMGILFVMWYYILKMFRMQWNKSTKK
jgi:hypothetical protein